MSLDASTAAAIAALVIACLAFFVACAQVVQQYFQTGQLIRLCDSVVYGRMPGKGHRRWIPSQFRFRIVYSIPQLCISPLVWPNKPPTMGSFKTGQHSLLEIEFLDEVVPPKTDAKGQSDPYPRPDAKGTGEASWVSFCRAMQEVCGRSIYFDLVDYDADRCPTDVPNVPMQISLRDVVVMGLFANMECISSDLATGSLSMQGHGGSIISSDHPTLGSLIRFIPRAGSHYRGYDHLTGGFGSTIEQRWIWRTLDACKVAGELFGYRRRRIVRRGAGVWTRYTIDTGYPNRHVTVDKSSSSKIKTETIRRNFVVIEANTDSRDPKERTVGRGIRDGDWKVQDLFHQQPFVTRNASSPRATPLATRQGADQSNESRLRPRRSYQAPRAESVSNKSPSVQETNPSQEKVASSVNMDEGNEGISGRDEAERLLVARDRQAERRERMELEQNDQTAVNDLVTRGLIQSPYHRGPLLLTYTDHSNDKSSDGQQLSTGITKEQHDAEARERERLAQRRQRDQERQDRWDKRNRNPALGDVDWFWMAQTSVFHGPWATPWGHGLHPSEIVGGIAVLLEALLGFFDQSTILYGDARTGSHPCERPTFGHTASWMLQGHSTHPSYAMNSQGGIIPSGTMFLFHMPCFQAKIPALELLYSYTWQCDGKYQDPVIHGHNLNVELMRLDGWLAYVGRLPEIADGRSNLLSQAPSLIQLVIEEFQLDFLDIETSATEGGLQDIQSLAANFMDFLADEQLTEAEQVYTLVACIRTLKVARLIIEGPDTHDIRGILSKDAQVYLI